MCGIVALVGSQPAAPQLLEGLRQLEYRGYDSAGLATVTREGRLTCLRAKGKLVNLRERVEAIGAPGSAASATRVGPPMASLRSAMPTLTEVSMAGWRWCRTASSKTTGSSGMVLKPGGVEFQSETDTEVIPHLVSAELHRRLQNGEQPSGSTLLQAVQTVLPQLQGAYALAVIWEKAPGALVVARRAAPSVDRPGRG